MKMFREKLWTETDYVLGLCYPVCLCFCLCFCLFGRGFVDSRCCVFGSYLLGCKLCRRFRYSHSPSLGSLSESTLSNMGRNQWSTTYTTLHKHIRDIKIMYGCLTSGSTTDRTLFSVPRNILHNGRSSLPPSIDHLSAHSSVIHLDSHLTLSKSLLAHAPAWIISQNRITSSLSLILRRARAPSES